MVRMNGWINEWWVSEVEEEEKYGILWKNNKFHFSDKILLILITFCSEKDKKEENKEQQLPETEAETIKKLKKELAVKDFLIDDLS